MVEKLKRPIKVIKIGGNVIDNELALATFLEDFAKVEGYKILVHGGGKVATKTGERLGVKANMHEGRRITDTLTLEVVTMVYAGLLNKQITAGLQRFGCNALGLSGTDGDLVRAKKRPALPIDFGWVGDVESVNAEKLFKLLGAGFSPVFCAITHDGKGQLLNTNADTIAAEMAKALSKEFEIELIYCFEKEGVLRNPQDDASCISNIGPALYRQLLDNGTITEGMKPKLQNCFEALEAGVSQVRIMKAERLCDLSGHPKEVGTLISGTDPAA